MQKIPTHGVGSAVSMSSALYINISSLRPNCCSIPARNILLRPGLFGAMHAVSLKNAIPCSLRVVWRSWHTFLEFCSLLSSHLNACHQNVP